MWGVAAVENDTYCCCTISRLPNKRWYRPSFLQLLRVKYDQFHHREFLVFVNQISLKFGLSEKHIKFEKIFLVVLTKQLIYLVNVKTIRKIFSNYVCISKFRTLKTVFWNQTQTTIFRISGFPEQKNLSLAMFSGL